LDADDEDVEDAEDDEDDMDPDQEDIVMPLRARPAAAGAAPPEAKPNLTLESDDADRANNPRPAKMRRGMEGNAIGVVRGEASEEEKPKPKPTKAAIAGGTGAVTVAELRAYLTSAGKVTIKDLLTHFKRRLKNAEDQAAFRKLMLQIAKIQEFKQPDGSSKKVVVLKQ